MITGSNDVEFGYPLIFLIINYHQQNLTLGFFLNIRVSKISIFVNFDLDLY